MCDISGSMYGIHRFIACLANEMSKIPHHRGEGPWKPTLQMMINEALCYQSDYIKIH
jgi:hypothetical protein